jgi:hypothetical protein
MGITCDYRPNYDYLSIVNPYGGIGLLYRGNTTNVFQFVTINNYSYTNTSFTSIESNATMEPTYMKRKFGFFVNGDATRVDFFYGQPYYSSLGGPMVMANSHFTNIPKLGPIYPWNGSEGSYQYAAAIAKTTGTGKNHKVAFSGGVMGKGNG